MNLKIAVVGAAGRMGRRIIALAIEEGDIDIVAAIERTDHPQLGSNAGLPQDLKLTDKIPQNADIVIDFSQPQGADLTIDFCAQNNVSLVLGTTGLSDEQILKIRAASEKTPIVFASNMSVGMNVLFSLVAKAAQMLGEDYDIEIVEHHHRFKKDAPSGSALSLAQSICGATDRDYPACLDVGRHGNDALREKGSIGIQAVRAGDIAGIHSVIFGTLGETVTLNHNAHSRDGFARGSLRAAKWLIEKPAALYSMKDVLGIE